MEDRIIYGPALTPDLKIYRNPNDLVNEPHMVFFSKETIEQIRTKFHKKNYDNNINIKHNGIRIQNVEMIKSFLIDENSNPSLPNEFKDLPLGTWMLAYKIENDEVWEMIKNNEIKGFSVEGIFEYVKYEEDDISDNCDIKLETAFDELLYQFSIGNTIENLKSGAIRENFERVKEWKNRFGYQFHIYSNDHLINKKPHFHLLNQSNNIDCRFFFDGTLYDCKSSGKVEKKVMEALSYFLTKQIQQSSLITLWNLKNPQCKL
jgi:hypothetical protein